MGELAEDIIDGSCCQICQQYFEHPKKNKKVESVGIYVHCYPAVCWDCWKEFKKEEKKDYTKAEVKTF